MRARHAAAWNEVAPVQAREQKSEARRSGAKRSPTERLERLESELALHRLVYEYCIAADSRDLELWSGVWTEDAVWAVSDDRSFVGLAEIRAAVQRQWAALPRMQHATSNHVVSVDRDEASGRSEVTVFVQLGGERWLTGGGTYVDRYRREGGRWKIAERRVVGAFDLELPPSGGTVHVETGSS